MAIKEQDLEKEKAEAIKEISQYAMLDSNPSAVYAEILGAAVVAHLQSIWKFARNKKTNTWRKYNNRKVRYLDTAFGNIDEQESEQAKRFLFNGSLKEELTSLGWHINFSMLRRMVSKMEGITPKDPIQVYHVNETKRFTIQYT